jgi:hypothetical protein
MIVPERRAGALAERRFVPRGGRRAHDLPGQYPPVLVADGYEAARTSCAGYLRFLRFEVAEAGGPDEAIAMIEAGWLPHVILANPEAADALTPLLAKSRRFLTPELIVMTGAPDMTWRRNGGLLVKPFRLRAMIRTVRHHLRREERFARIVRMPRRFA